MMIVMSSYMTLNKQVVASLYIASRIEAGIEAGIEA